MTMKQLRSMISEYLDKLNYERPFVNSDKFVINSYSKWACKELLSNIDNIGNLPFTLTPFEVLDNFRNKMNQYAYLNYKNSLGFSIAMDTAEYFIEEYWRYENGKQ